MIHHDIPWNLYIFRHTQVYSGLSSFDPSPFLRPLRVFACLRFRRQATQPGKMSPERSQQVGLKMAIASSLLYMFFIGKMCAFFFLNMLKQQQQLGYILYVQTNPYGHATRVPPLIGLFPVTFCLKPVDIRGVLPNFQQVESLTVFLLRVSPGMSRASICFPSQMGFKYLILGWKLQVPGKDKDNQTCLVVWTPWILLFLVSVSNVSTFGSSEASFLVDK